MTCCACRPAAPEQPVEPRSIVLMRNRPITIPHATWTPIPMDTLSGGTAPYLRMDGYVRGEPGYWLWCAYLRWASDGKGQRIVRFVRDIGGQHDHTGAEDRTSTAGKDYVSHVWPFTPIVGRPTGFEVWQSSGGPLAVEYAQLKAIELR